MPPITPCPLVGETCPSFPGTKVTLPKDLCRGNVTDDYLSALNARVRNVTFISAIHARRAWPPFVRFRRLRLFGRQRSCPLLETRSVSEKTKVLYYVLWMMHPLLEMGIAGFMLRRGLLRNFKFFFGYILTQLLTFAVLFPAFVWRSYVALFYLYWACNAISVTFGFLVIHEVFVDVFRMFHTLRDLGTVLFKWAGLVMLLVAAVVSVSTNSPEISPWMQAIVTSQRCVRMVQVGMVLFLLFFANFVGSQPPPA